MSTDRWMDKEVVVCIHNGMLAIKRNTFNLVLMDWVNLEPIIHSEVSQKEKDKYRIQFSSVAQLCLTLRRHGLQHARLPCPSPTPGACSNSCPWSQWCHPTHIYGIQKDGTAELICRAAMETQTQRTDSWAQQGKEREGRWREQHWDAHITICKQMASVELLPDAGSSNLVLRDHLEGRNSVGRGRVAQEGGDIHNTYGWFMLMYGRNPHNMVEQLFSNLK